MRTLRKVYNNLARTLGKSTITLRDEASPVSVVCFFACPCRFYRYGRLLPAYSTGAVRLYAYSCRFLYTPFYITYLFFSFENIREPSRILYRESSS